MLSLRVSTDYSQRVKMKCDSVEDVVKAAPVPGRYAVWARDKWDQPEMLDLYIFRDSNGEDTVREWFGVPLLPELSPNMIIDDGRLVGCEVEPDWRIP